jgi:DNA-binding transcriptional LysR family regulator
VSVNYELYRIFLQVARLGNFSRAAEGLFITQSAVSQAVKNLEGQLGVQLFFRGARQAGLTDEGRLLLAHVEQALNYLQIAEAKLQEIRGLQAGLLHIGASDTVCRYFLLPFLEKFNALYPKVKIRLINRTTSQLLGLLKGGAIDFGIVTLPLSQEGHKVLPFMKVNDIFVASPRYAHLSRKKIHISELADYPLLLLEKASASRMHFDRFLESHGVRLIPDIELESVDLLAQFACKGMGIACLLRESVQEEVSRKQLLELKTHEKIPPRELGIVTLPKVPLSLAASRMIQLIGSER